MISFSALAAHTTTETQKYLVIATGTGEVFNSNGIELGADQEVVSSSEPGDSSGDGEGQIHGSFPASGVNLHDTFIPSIDKPGVTDDEVNNNRWVNNDSTVGGVVGVVDYLPGAKNLSEAPDYSGNVAITHKEGQFQTVGSDYFASIGFNCQQDSVGDVSPDCWKSKNVNNSWNENGAGGNNGFTTLDYGNGVNNFDSSALLSELDDWRLTIDAMTADTTWNMDDITDRNYGKNAGPLITDIDAIDNNLVNGNQDGYTVIDIVGSSGTDFKVSNTDWILKTTQDKIVIFRMDRGGSFLFDNSSIMMGCKSYDYELNDKSICQDDDVDQLGAIFYTSDEYAGYESSDNPGDDAFNLDNVILGGVGLWDLDSKQNTTIVINNAQGCTQLISSEVHLSSKDRFNRCALTAKTTEIPEPSTIVLFTFALLVLVRSKFRSS